MRNARVLKLAAVAALFLLAGCSSKVAEPEQYSGFLKDYSNLKETTSSSGKTELRWVDPNYNPSNYDNIVYTPIVYYPELKPTTQMGKQVLDQILNYTNQQMKMALQERRPLVTTAGPRNLIFRGAITSVTANKEGLQFYEVLPLTLVVAGTQAVTGHRTMDTNLFFEGELIDARTKQTVMKVVRKGEGKDLANENTPITADTVKQVIDTMAIDAVKFDPKAD